MTIRRLTPADYVRMPWRNGGGTTTELVVEPPTSDLATGRFLYRLSIADVASDGPFSRFPGYDRHIMLLSGAGMTLDCGADGTIELAAPRVARAFSGDQDVRGSLAAGAVRDLNLIVDRARARGSLEATAVAGSARWDVPGGSILLVHVLSGALDVAAEGETLVADEPLAAEGRAEVVLGRIRPV